MANDLKKINHLAGLTPNVVLPQMSSPNVVFHFCGCPVRFSFVWDRTVWVAIFCLDFVVKAVTCGCEYQVVFHLILSFSLRLLTWYSLDD